jgi:hypothetical protein
MKATTALLFGLAWATSALAQTPPGPGPVAGHTPAVSTRVPAGARGNVVTPGGIFDPVALSDRAFYLHTLGHRCIDFGGQASWRAGAPVYLYSCNGSVAQQVRVKELDSTHDVELRVQSQFCIGVRGGQVSPAASLELQSCNGSSAQRFALDGDAILVGSQPSGTVTREFAIAPQEQHTANRTPLIVTARALNDAEYFRADAVDHSDSRLTNGFVLVSSEQALDWALSLGWGTVIEIDDRAPLWLSQTPKRLGAGVTLRGYRKLVYQGPEVRTCVAEGGHAIELAGVAARVTGLRLRGQTQDPTCTGSLGKDSSAIGAFTGAFNDAGTVWLDHLDIGYWNGHGIDILGPTVLDQEPCATPLPPVDRHPSVLAIGNFVHHNQGYGIVTGMGAFVVVRGNVFYLQLAHSVASDPVNSSGYQAIGNFFLSNERATHDVDMHGSENTPDHPSQWVGGHTGDHYEVGSNTFLHTGHQNIDVRGTPCHFVRIHDNVFRQAQRFVIENHSTKPLELAGNSFETSPDPMLDIAVGDFDGDGVDDLFVGTGAAWYFSSGGRSEWRLLNTMLERASELRFGDFDGDGRTDVLAVHGSNIDVSWGGVSPWQTINVVAWQISEIVVGDFDGDHVSDLLLSTRSQWFYAPGGRNWTPWTTSQVVHIRDLLFGDFTHSGHTQILRISSDHQWELVRALNGMWEPLGTSRDAALGELVVADVDGNGFADVVRFKDNRWEFTSPALGPGWVFLWETSLPIKGLPLGRFDGQSSTDVARWSDRHFYYAPAARGPFIQLSRQDMY